MRILSAEDMAETDRRSVEQGVSIQMLMDKAGIAVARFCLQHYAGEGPIVVLCGKGNNGGDGLVAARELAKAGREVRIVLLAAVADVRGESAAALKALRNLPEVAMLQAPTREQLQQAINGAALIIDAVVGTGFQPPLRGLAADAKEVLEGITTPVVAVDLPSGWDADSQSEISDTAFRADAVVTFVAPKTAHVFGALTREKTFGPVVVADIGTPKNAVHASKTMRWSGASKKIAEKPRGINGNKGKFGHVMVVGGAVGKAGAPSMASLAALRTGAGLVTAAVTPEILPTVASIAPELMLTELKHVLPDDASLKKLLKGITLMAVGPGLGEAGETPQFARDLIEAATLPMVIDADALNAIAGRSDWLKAVAKNRTLVLTPHPGEMARLISQSVKEVEADRIGVAKRFATEHGVTVVLKGWRTLIAHPDGCIAVNTTGNPGMAKGGSGDVLTGIVAAMLAQYGGIDKVSLLAQPKAVAEAVEAAVFLHGLAGDFATLAQDEHTTLATDTVRYLWQAFRCRVTDADGFTWIAGTAAQGVMR